MKSKDKNIIYCRSKACIIPLVYTRSVSSIIKDPIHRVKNAGNFSKLLKQPLCNDLANAKDQSISDQSIFLLNVCSRDRIKINALT